MQTILVCSASVNEPGV